jgi:integrase
MATLEKRNDTYRIVFRFRGHKYSRSLKTGTERSARSALARLEDNLHRIELGTLEVPDDADLATFLLSDGRKIAKPAKKTIQWTLGKMLDAYVKAIRVSVEDNTLSTTKIHVAHLKRILRASTPVDSFGAADLQRYVDRRSREKSRQKKLISITTIRKEVATLNSAWRWGSLLDITSTILPTKSVRYGKLEEKPPFQTWEEIERKIARKKMSEIKQKELWECLFLTVPQIAQLLSHVQKESAYPYLHPMMTFAAYTGARRSELMRSELDDIDLHAATAIIREKKRVRGKVTTRRVPLSPELQSVLKAWLAIHPGGEFTFSPSTGGKALTKEQARGHFKGTLSDSKWKVVRGWHLFRHSFCSNCAAAGIDQRIINAWVGHQTDDMVKRYRHLLPNQEQAAIQLAFGKAG